MRFLPLVLLPSLASGAILHVDSTAGPGGDGSSPAQAFEDLQDALTAAQPKDVIHVAGGVYLPSQSADPTESFIIPNFVTVIGGFKPGLTDGSPSPDDYPTILSGDLGKDDTDPNSNYIIASSDDQVGVNSHHVVTVSGAADVVVLQGLVITAGNAVPAPTNHAGGLLATSSNLEIDNCWFRGNQGGGRGGALHLNDCNAEVVNCDFAGNYSAARGGAIGTVSGTDADFINCLVRGNESVRGGGFNFNDSTGLLLNCTVSGNNGTTNGGGIQAHSSTVTVTDSIIWWNLGPSGSRANLGSSINEISGAVVTSSPSSIIENESGSDPDFESEFDPAFAPDTAGNHRLSRGSPAINAGTSSANNTSVDYAGNPRVSGIAIDLGAFETVPFDFHVDDTAGGANNGTSWANAYTTLQPALAAALAGDRILIAEGVYTPTTATDSFEVPADIEILGGYPNGGGTRDPDTHRSILSGDVTGNDNNLDGDFIAEGWNELVDPNCHTVVRAKPGHDLTPTNVFDGLVITAGKADGLPGEEDPTTRGGGVHLDLEGQPTFRNCLFSGNRGADDGGAVFINLPSAGALPDQGPFFESCTFAGNRCTDWGGAVALFGGDALFEDCEFTGNDSRNGSAVAHRALGGEVLFRRCSFRGNDNISGGNGGTIFTEQNTLTDLDNCLISGNDGDGIVLLGAMNLRGLTISGNDGDPVAVVNLGSLVTWNSVFWNNTGVFSDTFGGQLPTFHHSLVEGYSNSASGFANNGNLDGTNAANDPDFISPSGGGSAPTTAGNYRLNFDSPVMSVGDDDEIGAGPDLDGNLRISGHTVDLGCYEYQLPDADNDGIPDAFELAHTSPSSATSLNPNSNLDDDPFTALQEFAFDLDPNVAEGTDAAYRIAPLPPNNPANPFRMALIWTPNPDARHHLLITGEHSNDLGITDPWFETASGAATANFGGLPGEMMIQVQTFLPQSPTQYLRLRIEK